MSKNRHNRKNDRVRLIDNKQTKENTNKQDDPISCGCVEIIDSEYWSGCKRLRIKDSQKGNKMESSRSKRNKVRSPRMKASHIQYAPEGRKGNVYIDEDGRKVYRTSGKSGQSKRYVVMDDGELTRGERIEKSNTIYQTEETEYETMSEADSEYIVPVRPKGESSRRRVLDDNNRILTKRMIAEDDRPVLRTADGNTTRSSYIVRSRPQSEYVLRDKNGTLRTQDGYLVQSSRPASEIVIPSRERVVTRRVLDDSSLGDTRGRKSTREQVVTRRVVDESNLHGRYIVRSRPSSEKRVVDNKEVVYVARRPRSEEREVRYVTTQSRERKPIGYVTKELSNDKTLQRQEYIDLPTQYVIPRPPARPPTRDVGCQMTTNYIIQQPPRPKKLLRNVQTQTLRKQKHRKIKTATHYYQTETVEVVQDPTPRDPTPPPRILTPPPRIPTPPPRTPTPEPPQPPKQKKKKKKSKEKEMRIVLKHPNDPEPVYDRIEDLEVVPGSSKIYYEAPKKELKNTDIPQYAYYEPSEYSLPKKTREKDIMAEPADSEGSRGYENVSTKDRFYSVPLNGKTTFYGPYYMPGYSLPPGRRAKKKRSRVIHKTIYDHPKYVETKGEKKKKKTSKKKLTRSNSPYQIKTYLRKVPVQINDAEFVPSSSLKTHNPDKRSNRSVRIEEYGAKLSHGPSFYMNSDENIIPNAMMKPDLNSTLMYVNPDTDKVEVLKYSTETRPKSTYVESEPRYVALPGLDGRAENQDDEPLVIIDKELTKHTNGQLDLEDTYLSPVNVQNDTPVQLDPEYPLMKKPKGKAHMVRVGGGWMKVEHHRNHHTPLKIYEIPRDANDDKFLYIKSRFSTNKKEVPIAYKKYREEIIRG